jgi:thiol-disulfide isomerase/thioredoxin
MNAPRVSFPALQVLALAVCVLGVLGTGMPLSAAEAPAKVAAPAMTATTATTSAKAAQEDGKDAKVTVGHNDIGHESATFKFKEVPSPVKTKATTKAKITIVDGEKDENSGGVEVLNDGKLPSDEDEPASNFFFNAGTEGGRILLDLGSVIRVTQVNTYSWHTDTRAPQVYTLYAADGAASDLNLKPAKDVDPSKVGWKLIAKVDTRPKTGEPGGQYGVSISGPHGSLGQFRYLLIAASRTESDDGFGNTFFSEINVIDANEVIEAPAAPTDKPTEKSPAEPKAGRTANDINADWNRASRDLKNVMASPADLIDPAKRQVLAPKVLPLLKAMVPLLAERAAGKAQSPGGIADDTIRVQACLSCLGDADTIKDLASLAADTDSPASLRARLTQNLAAWWQAAKDEKAQEKVLGDMQKLATASPANGRIYYVLMTMKDIGAATPALSDKAEGIVADTLTGGETSFIKATRAGRIMQEQTMNKPIEFSGKTVDDKEFSTREYKGKVILVDFWATWCHPCVEENPRVKALYAKYHDKGLEIVGISCDSDGAKLATYVKTENIPWVQMWDKKAQTGGDSWHPIATKWGILSIPRMFLIDRNGNLRTVEARANMEEMIPKLLEEKAAEKAAPTGTGR